MLGASPQRDLHHGSHPSARRAGISQEFSVASQRGAASPLKRRPKEPLGAAHDPNSMVSQFPEDQSVTRSNAAFRAIAYSVLSEHRPSQPRPNGGASMVVRRLAMVRGTSAADGSRTREPDALPTTNRFRWSERAMDT